MSAAQLLPPELQKISEDACAYVKAHKRELIERFAGEAFPAAKRPFSIFMAGSPGAGKTEISRALAQRLRSDGRIEPIIRIDGDEIREMLPGYTGGNAHLFQRAISIGVSKLHDYALQKKKNFILDGTFSQMQRAHENVERSLKVGRQVIVIYVYQDPLLSWAFTKKREAIEGRNIPREAFIERFFASREVVRSVKEMFGDQVRIWLVMKDLKTQEGSILADVAEIDSRVQIPYSKAELKAILPL